MLDLGQVLMGDSSDILIDVRVYYTSLKNKYGVSIVKVLDDEKAEKMLEVEEDKAKVYCLNTKWKQISWREQNKLYKNCQSPNVATGAMEIDWSAYRDQRVKTLMKEWDLSYDNKPIPLSAEMIDRLPADIVLKLFEKYEDTTGINGEDEGK